MTNSIKAVTYQGGCHCGLVRFSIQAPPITDGLRCNCSICTMKGAVMSKDYFSPSEFKPLCGHNSLSIYQFGDRMVKHFFCPGCGVYPYHEARDRSGHYRVNLGCLQGLDLSSLAVSWVDGRSF